MTFRGTVRNGKAERDDDAAFAGGPRADTQPSKAESIYDIFMRHQINDPSLPKDYATEIDHYLYGTPKRFGKAIKAKARGKAKTKSAMKRTPKRKGKR